jgi:hypothetical protein
MQSDKEALREILMGVGFGFVIIGALTLFIITSGKSDNKAQSQDRFKVVDQYGPCEVVRYMPRGEAKYVYFLDCK